MSNLFKAKIERVDIGSADGKKYSMRMPTVSQMAQIEALTPIETGNGKRSAWLLILCCDEIVEQKDGKIEYKKAFRDAQLNDILSAQIGSPVSGLMVAVDTMLIQLFNELTENFTKSIGEVGGKKSTSPRAPVKK